MDVKTQSGKCEDVVWIKKQALLQGLFYKLKGFDYFFEGVVTRVSLGSTMPQRDAPR